MIPTKRALRRRGITAVLSAMIVIILSASVLAGFFLLVYNDNFMLNQAAQSKDSSLQAAESEHLLVAVSRITYDSSTWLSIQASNVGSVPSTITAVFVTSPSGQMLSSWPPHSTSLQADYLVGPPALSLSLPLTVTPGSSTATMRECNGGNCNILINPAALSSSSGDLVVDVLTQAGNVFSAQYPQPSGTTSSTIYSNLGTTTTVTTLPNTISYATTSTLTSFSTCFDCTTSTTVGQSTPALVLALNACPASAPCPCPTSDSSCPLSVLNGQGITVVGTVTVPGDVSATVTGVQIVLSPADGIPTGTASVLQTSSCSLAPGSVTTTGTTSYTTTTSTSYKLSTTTVSTTSTITETVSTSTTTITFVPVNISPGGSAEFTCSFTGYSGSVGGTVTFDGYAVGTVSGSAETSAEATSNPLQIGYIASAPPISLSPYSFNYTSYCTTQDAVCLSQLGEASATHVSASTSYVALYAKITNDYDQPITLLDLTDISTQSPYVGPDPAFFMVAGVCYPGEVGCGNPSTPTIASYNCYSNEPSTTVGYNCLTLPVGGSADIIFAACEPGETPGPGSTTWVWQSSSSADMLQEAQGTGSQSGGGCSGVIGWAPPVGSSVAFVLFYTDGYFPTGTIYSSLLPFSSMFETLPSSVTVSCSPGSVTLGTAATCTGLVNCCTGTGAAACAEDPSMQTSGSPIGGCPTSSSPSEYAPSGDLTFSTSPSNGISPASSECELSYVTPYEAECSVSFTPSTQPAYLVTAYYGGSSLYGESEGSIVLDTVKGVTTEYSTSTSTWPTTTLSTTSTSIYPTTTKFTTSSSIYGTTTLSTTSTSIYPTTTLYTTSSSIYPTTTLLTTSTSLIPTTTLRTTSSSIYGTTTLSTTSSSIYPTTTLLTTSTSIYGTTTLYTTSSSIYGTTTLYTTSRTTTSSTSFTTFTSVIVTTTLYTTSTIYVPTTTQTTATTISVPVTTLYTTSTSIYPAATSTTTSTSVYGTTTLSTTSTSIFPITTLFTTSTTIHGTTTSTSVYGTKTVTTTSTSVYPISTLYTTSTSVYPVTLATTSSSIYATTTEYSTSTTVTFATTTFYSTFTTSTTSTVTTSTYTTT